jgi:L-methionine (R)-S-oxide reductase
VDRKLSVKIVLVIRKSRRSSYMNTKVNLDAIVNELDFLSEEFSSFLNRQTGDVVHLSHEDMRQVEEEGEDQEENAEELEESIDAWNAETLAIARAVMADDQGIYLSLPSKFDINEYDIMAEFCSSVKNQQISDSLSRMIQGRGAFGRFKDSIRLYGIEKNWYKFRDRALKEIVKDWCEGEGIEYIDDEPTTPKPENEDLSEKQLFYRTLVKGLRDLLGGERDFLANMANLAAVLYDELPEVNWAGFYLLKGQDLVLGPFQGKPACTRIGPGKGVCGAAANKRETLLVENVKEFPGHIACDEASKSEIVVTMIRAGKLIGVLDLDSPIFARFDDDDRAGLEEIVQILLEASNDY